MGLDVLSKSDLNECSKILKPSGNLYLREGLINQFIKLRVYAIQRGAERKRQDGVIAGKHRDGGSEDPRLQAREQPRDLPAVGCDEITVGAGWPENETFEPQAAQVVCHLSAGVIADGDAKQVGNQDPQVAIMEAVNQMLKQGQSQEQGHDSRLTELQGRHLLTAFGNGRLHHTLDAVSAQAAVMADAFDSSKRRLISRPIFCR